MDKVELSFLISIAFFGLGEFSTNFQLQTFENCAPGHPLSLYVTIIGEENGYQLIDANATLPFNVGDNVLLNWTTGIKRGEKYVRLISIVEKNACLAMNQYIGEFAYDLERKLGLVPGLCPIPKGNYCIHNHKLMFDRISIKTFPVGKLRFVIELIDKHSSKVLGCVIIMLRNIK